MYVSSISDSDKDEYTSIRTPQRKYFVAIDALPSQTFRERFRQQSDVDIGTTLVLMVGEPYQQSPAAGSTIVRVVCNGSDIAFTRNELTSSVSFEVLAAYSGKFIEVYLSDTGCCGIFGGQNVNPNWMVLPALIFPRAATVAQKCVLCPVGKFHGAYGATNMSVCTDIAAPLLGRRSLQVPASHLRRSNSALVPQNALPFRTYTEIQGKFVNILEIQKVPLFEPSTQPGFALEAILDTNDATFVLANSVELSGNIRKIYDAQGDNMQITHRRAIPKEIGENTVTVLSMQGVYAPANDPAVVGKYKTTISFKLNTDMNQISAAVASAIRINLAARLNVDIAHVSALSFEQVRMAARRLLEVKASVTVSSLSREASKNIETALTRSVFNTILAISSNNVLIATDFEVATKKVGGPDFYLEISHRMMLYIIGGSVGLVFLIVCITLTAVACKKCGPTPAQYRPVYANHVGFNNSMDGNNTQVPPGYNTQGAPGYN